MKFKISILFVLITNNILTMQKNQNRNVFIIQFLNIKKTLINKKDPLNYGLDTFSTKNCNLNLIKDSFNLNLNYNENDQIILLLKNNYMNNKYEHLIINKNNFNQENFLYINDQPEKNLFKLFNNNFENIYNLPNEKIKNNIANTIPQYKIDFKNEKNETIFSL